MSAPTRIRVSTPVLALLPVFAGVPACNTASSEPPPAGAVVSFAFHGFPGDTLRVQVTRPGTIDLVREILAGTRPPLLPVGPIRRGPGIDPRYPFHYLPDALELAPVAIELCDGAPMHTPAAVQAFITAATGSPDAETAIWCPWTAYPIHLESPDGRPGTAR